MHIFMPPLILKQQSDLYVIHIILITVGASSRFVFVLRSFYGANRSVFTEVIFDTTYPRIKKLLWTAFQVLQVSGAGFGDDQSLADYISGSQTATNMGHGSTCRRL